MIDGITSSRPPYFYQKDIIGYIFIWSIFSNIALDVFFNSNLIHLRFFTPSIPMVLKILGWAIPWNPTISSHDQPL